MENSGPMVITGASGFIGVNLCRHFLRLGREVVAVQSPAHGSWRLDAVEKESRLRKFPGSLERVSLDLRHRADVRSFVQKRRPSVLLNCAAYGAYPSQGEADRIYQVNFDAVRFLIEELKAVEGFRAFVQAGSSSEYGLNCTRPPEDAPTRPDSEYAVSKVAATQLLVFQGLKHGFPGWTLRLYSVYGPFEDASRLIPQLLLRAAEGKLPPLADPRVSRDFVHIDDVCLAFQRVIEKSGELPRGDLFNIGTGIRTRLEDLVATARSAFGITADPRWGSMPDRRWDHPDWYADCRKAEKALSWKARMSLSEGLLATRRWMEEDPGLIETSIREAVTPVMRAPSP